MTPYKTPLADAMDYVEYKKRLQRMQLFETVHKWHTHKWDLGTPWRHTVAYHHFFQWRMEWWRSMEKQFPEFIKGGVRCHGSFLSEISERAMSVYQQSSAPPT